MYPILSEIEKADDCLLSEMVQAIIRRYGTLHPEDDIFFLSLPRNNPRERKKTLNALLRLLNTK